MSFRDPILCVLAGCIAAGVAYLTAWSVGADQATALYVSLAAWGPFVTLAGIAALGDLLFTESKRPTKLWDFDASDPAESSPPPQETPLTDDKVSRC
jgi:uncharacterized membrane protein